MPRISVVDRRAELISAALRVVAAEGVAAATTRAIVAEAGMSLASFHYAFASRDELLAELVAHVVEHERVVLDVGELLTDEEATQEHSPTLEAVVRAGLQRYVDLLRADPAREAAMQELSAYAMRTPGLEHLALEQYRRYEELAREALALAARVSGSTWTQPVDEIARTVIAFTDGLTLGWLVRRDDAEARRLVGTVAHLVATLAEPGPR
ncbi:TetR/AcrR family transcriptional regulator [Plantibacter sp. T3]|uniref:TetR/AcrR family transcriptional regulator n=1 Tax=unclassified Plantibacter TaxID=2624265 RepID=UPI0012F40C8F|nr:TetR family transcriptional regulator C-terminal domain-containing protein [Plantibacter sp. T3]VXB92947.1 TetR family transcriptional regulator [Plantibacter sp. T3]